MATIYDEIGGAPGVAAAVDDFYARLLRDPDIGHFFDGPTMPRQILHLRASLSTMLGGPRPRLAGELSDAHAGVGVTAAAFEQAVVHLMAALNRAGLGARALAEVAARLAPLRADVVSA